MYTSDGGDDSYFEQHVRAHEVVKQVSQFKRRDLSAAVTLRQSFCLYTEACRLGYALECISHESERGDGRPEKEAAKKEGKLKASLHYDWWSPKKSPPLTCLSLPG